MTRVAVAMQDARVWLDDAFLGPDEAAATLTALLEEIPWSQPEITVFGRRHRVPRLTCWLGEPGAVYTWSGLRQQPTPWTPGVAALRARVEEAIGLPFDSALANLYRDGSDAMGWHADDEPELGPEPVIASVSLGSTRDMRFRHRQRADIPPVSLALAGGSLLVMEGPTQRAWQHAIPRRRRVAEPRINLTFRRLRPG